MTSNKELRALAAMMREQFGCRVDFAWDREANISRVWIRGAPGIGPHGMAPIAAAEAMRAALDPPPAPPPIAPNRRDPSVVAETDRFTLLLCPAHQRAGDSIERPITLLHSDEYLSEQTPAELRLSLDEAKLLLSALSLALTRAEQPARLAEAEAGARLSC